MADELIKKDAEYRRRGDDESIAISFCVSALEPLTADQTARVLRYLAERYVHKLTAERDALDAKIAVVKQHAREQACDLCRSLESGEPATQISAMQ
jgi:hypothetical protein